MPLSRRELLSRLSAGGAAITYSATAQIEPIVIVVPDDGGTPRDPTRIHRIGPAEFRVVASVEEGQSPLTHAVSRVDLIVRNSGPETDAVLHIDLSGDDKRVNFDTSHFGGMPERDYVYIQPPGEPWRRVQGGTDGWVATVRFRTPRGDTKVGLSPISVNLIWMPSSLPRRF